MSCIFAYEGTARLAVGLVSAFLAGLEEFPCLVFMMYAQKCSDAPLI